MPKYFLTGATGFLGSQIALHLLENPDVTIYALVRTPSGAQEDAQTRLEMALFGAAWQSGISLTAEELHERVYAIPGDLTLPQLGISTQHQADLNKLDAIWHIAASLRYRDRDEKYIMAHNVEGMKEVIALAQRNEIGVFNHVSTAYVAGSRSGMIPEGPFDAQYPPLNIYEKSKRKGELALQQVHAQTGLPFRIFRPSIIIGHSKTFHAISDFGLYGCLTSVLTCRKRVERRLGNSKVIHALSKNESMFNFIPVDFVALDAVNISRQENTLNQFFHLTTMTPCPARRFSEIVTTEVFGDKVRVEFVEDVSDLNEVDQMMRRFLDFYNPYAFYPKVFERAHLNTVKGCTGPVEHARALEELPLYVRHFVRAFLAEHGETRAPAALRAATAGTVK